MIDLNVVLKISGNPSTFLINRLVDELEDYYEYTDYYQEPDPTAEDERYQEAKVSLRWDELRHPWDFSALVQPILDILEQSGIPATDIYVDCGLFPDYEYFYNSIQITSLQVPKGINLELALYLPAERKE